MKTGFRTFVRSLFQLATVSAVAVSVPSHAADDPQTILFVGNSFTQGANSAVLRYRPDSIDDLGKDGVGGIPALFARFAEQSGQKWKVAHATRGGATLADHLRDRLPLIDRSWDVVVLQEYSTLDPQRPGNSETTMSNTRTLTDILVRANPQVEVLLMATWSRADQIYQPKGHWYAKPVGSMAQELRVALDGVDTALDDVDGVIPVGEAWNRAMSEGVADPNPYDGTAFGQVDLWSYDQYHASAAGSYLEALTVFGRVTGIDPRTFGGQEIAAHELGLDPRVAVALQRIAAIELGFPKVTDDN